jgi:isocitrate lyase
MSNQYKTLGNHTLQPWYSVEITEPDAENAKHVLFHSSIHKNMPVKLTFCFSGDFTDYEILNDHSVMTKFIEHFGVDSFV